MSATTKTQPMIHSADGLKDLDGRTLRNVAKGIGLTVNADAKSEDIIKAVAQWAKHEENGWERVSELSNPTPAPRAAAKSKTAAPAAKAAARGKAPAAAKGKSAPPSTQKSGKQSAAAKSTANGARPGRESQWMGKHIHRTDKGKTARRSESTRRSRNWHLIKEGMKFETYLEKADGGRAAGMADLTKMFSLGHVTLK